MLLLQTEVKPKVCITSTNWIYVLVLIEHQRFQGKTVVYPVASGTWSSGIILALE